MAGDIRNMMGKERGDDIPSYDWDLLSGGSLSMAANTLVNDAVGNGVRACSQLTHY